MASNYTLAGQKGLSRSFLQCKSPAQLASLLRMPHYKLRRVILYPDYRRKVIARASGKARVLHIPGLRLKKVQRELNRYLQAVYYDLMPAQVHGFVLCPADGVRARNIVTNALPHIGKKVVISMDLFRFFPSVKALMVQKLFLGPPFHFDPNLASALALLCTYRHSLPTGSPLSPVISNFVCLGMDAELALLARKHGYAYTRYADDLTFSGERPPEAGFFESVTRITGEHGFTLNAGRPGYGSPPPARRSPASWPTKSPMSTGSTSGSSEPSSTPSICSVPTWPPAKTSGSRKLPPIL
jgi:RNA-directed DNA polymerase